MSNYLKVEKSEISFETLKKKNYYPTELENVLDRCDALIIPLENFRPGYSILFPENTKELLRALKSHDLKVDVLCKNNEFNEIELHDANLIIGHFIVYSIVLPLLVNLISSYVYDKITKKKKNNNVKVVLHVQNKTGKTIKFEYDGPSDKLEAALKEVEKMVKETDK